MLYILTTYSCILNVFSIHVVDTNILEAISLLLLSMYYINYCPSSQHDFTLHSMHSFFIFIIFFKLIKLIFIQIKKIDLSYNRISTFQWYMISSHSISNRITGEIINQYAYNLCLPFIVGLRS